MLKNFKFNKFKNNLPNLKLKCWLDPHCKKNLDPDTWLIARVLWGRRRKVPGTYVTGNADINPVSESFVWDINPEIPSEPPSIFPVSGEGKWTGACLSINCRVPGQPAATLFDKFLTGIGPCTVCTYVSYEVHKLLSSICSDQQLNEAVTDPEVLAEVVQQLKSYGVKNGLKPFELPARYR